MSLKSGIYKHRRTVRRVVAGVVVLCCLWAVYIRYVSPTRVALVNFPAYQASSIALANRKPVGTGGCADSRGGRKNRPL